jgi:zinc transport system ATP-binding protein
MISFKNVFYSHNNKEILSNINLAIDKGEFAGIIGPNGGGKTTLLKLMLGLLKPSLGSVNVFEKQAHKLGRERYKIGYVPQAKDSTKNYPVSLLELVLMGSYSKCGFFKNPGEKEKNRALSLLKLFQMEERSCDNAFSLSGGMLQKAYIARALISDPDILLLDEPTVGLDVFSLDKFYSEIVDIKNRFSLTVVMVSHDIDILVDKCDYIIGIDKTLHFHKNGYDLAKSFSDKCFKCELEDFMDFKNRLKRHAK